MLWKTLEHLDRLDPLDTFPDWRLNFRCLRFNQRPLNVSKFTATSSIRASPNRFQLCVDPPPIPPNPPIFHFILFISFRDGSHRTPGVSLPKEVPASWTSGRSSRHRSHGVVMSATTYDWPFDTPFAYICIVCRCREWWKGLWRKEAVASVWELQRCQSPAIFCGHMSIAVSPDGLGPKIDLDRRVQKCYRRLITCEQLHASKSPVTCGWSQGWSRNLTHQSTGLSTISITWASWCFGLSFTLI